jgi:ParB-like chromosome segregation protein Spo0J
MMTTAVAGVERIGEYVVHPVAGLFPMLAGRDRDELSKSILENGLLVPVVIDGEGRVVDGRNRLSVCVEHDIQPELEELPEGVDPVGYIAAMNLHRRHLTTSQRAGLAARMVQSGETTIDRAAETMKVGRTSVVDAKRVMDRAEPELKAAVVRGTVDVGTASNVLDQAPEVQQHVAAAEDHTEAKRRAKDAEDAQFSKKKWRDSAERKISTILAQAPIDLQDWASREVRDITGARSAYRPTETLHDAHEEAELFSADEFVARVDRSLKDVPASDRKLLRVEIGRALVGGKPADFVPDFGEMDFEQFLRLAIGINQHLVKGAVDLLDDQQAKEFRRFVKSLKAMMPSDAVEASEETAEVLESSAADGPGF